MADALSQAENRNNQGNSQYGIHQYRTAIQFYTQAIELQPQIAKYYGNRAACYIMLDDYIKGLQDAKRTIELDVGNEKGYIRIATCCLASGDLQYAEKTLVMAKGIFTESEQVRVKLAIVKSIQQHEISFKLEMEQKKYNDALEHIEQCIAHSPKCLNYILRRAECLIYLEKFDEAEKITEAVLKYKPFDEDALYLKILSKYNRDDVEKMYKHLVDLKRQLPDHPKTTKLYRNASKIKTTTSEMEEAIIQKNYAKAYELITAALKVDDRNKYVNKKLYQKKINIAGKENSLLWNGTRDCTDYMLIYGHDMTILHKRAEYYMNMEEYEDAVADYEEIIETEPTKENKEKLKKAKQLLDLQLKHEYQILKISEKCTADQVKKAYRELTKQYHPDKNGKISPERKKVLENKIIRIRNAQTKLLKELNKN